MTVTMNKKYRMDDVAYRQTAAVYRKKAAENPANNNKNERARVILADKEIIKNLPKMDVIKKDFFITEEEARHFLKIDEEKQEDVSVKASDKTETKEEKYSLKEIEKFKAEVLADAETIRKDPALTNKIRADLAKLEKEDKKQYEQVREALFLTPAGFLFKAAGVLPVPDYDNAVEHWLAETISTGNKKVTTGEIYKLFKTKPVSEGKTEEVSAPRVITVAELKKFLTDQAGWRKEAVAILFGGEADEAEITLKDFKEVIYKNVKKFNDRCNDTEYLRALGIYEGKNDEKYIGKKYQEYDYFYKYNHQEAKDAVLKIQERKDNPAGLNKILKRFKSFDGDVNNWSVAEIDLAYVYLSLNKEYALDDGLEIVENTRNINYRKFCRAYGLDQKEGVAESAEKEDSPHTAKKIDGILTAYAGDEKELTDNQKYIRWWDFRDDHSKLTKDDNFMIRRAAKNKKGQVVGFPEAGLGLVDVKYLWVKNGAGWSVKGSKYLPAVVKINEKYYECVIRDNTDKADIKKTRYKNLNKKESEPIK